MKHVWRKTLNSLQSYKLGEVGAKDDVHYEERVPKMITNSGFNPQSRTVLSGLQTQSMYTLSSSLSFFCFNLNV